MHDSTKRYEGRWANDASIPVIRPATFADVVAIQSVARQTWTDTYADAIAEDDIDQFLDSAYSVESIEAAIRRLGIGFVVAEREGEVAGYAMAGVNRDGEAELFALYVLPSQQGAGIGYALWNAAVSVIIQDGYRRMCCWVLVSNTRARRFYERQGAMMTEERTFVVGSSPVREVRYCFVIGG